MPKTNIIIALITFVLINGCQNKAPTNDDQLRGMWRLDKFEFLDSASNKWIDDTSYIGRRSGYILYDGKGHMGVHLTPKGYKEFNSTKNIDSLNMDELKALLKFYKSNFVYFADYVLVNDSTIQHKRLSATDPKNWGTTLTRDFRFNKDTLVLTAYEHINGKKSRIRWIKL